MEDPICGCIVETSTGAVVKLMGAFEVVGDAEAIDEYLEGPATLGVEARVPPSSSGYDEEPPAERVDP